AEARRGHEQQITAIATLQVSGNQLGGFVLHRGGRVSIAPYAPEEIARLRRLMDDDVSLDRAWHELNGRPSGAAASTVEALMFALRSRGVQALGEPHVLRRLAQLDNAQLREIAVRLQKLEQHIASAWAPEDVEVLLA